MMRVALCCGLLLAAATTVAQAQEGLSLSVGADYSTGEYGSETTTEIFSVPFSAKWASDRWTWKASLPWLRVDGDPSVLPGLGGVINTNPRGRGRGGTPVPDPTAPVASGTASGIGDLRLSATYALSTGPLGVDLTGLVKVPTADEDKGLGTGETDYGIAVDLYRDFDGTLLFGGAGYTLLGDNEYLPLRNVANANIGASRSMGTGTLGLVYDWRQAATEGRDDRSELTGFYSTRAGERGKVQVYASAGLSDGSPDWGAGVNFTTGF